MVNEIRDYGDGKTIVLYTNENVVYRKLRDSTKVIKSVHYSQEQKHRWVMVGCDLYFAKKHHSWLQRKIASPDPFEKGDF